MKETILERINSVSVSKDDLWELAEDTQNFKGEPCLEAGLFLISRRVDGDFQKASAIMFRMEALTHLLKEEGLPGWILPRQPDGSYPTPEAVFAAAAIQPLLEKGNEVVFERESFLKKVLELAEPEGEG